MIEKLFRKRKSIPSVIDKKEENICEDRDRFFASMSHEIRTPVNGIAGFTQLLKETKLSDEQNELVDTIHSSSMHLLELINAILDFSKMSANKLDLEHVSFNLFRQIEDTVETHALSASKKDVELGLYIDPNIRTMLMGDPTKLSQVIINLVGNAIKFTNSYGHVDIAVKQIEDSVKAVTLEFSVSDTGIGMTKAQTEKIFEPFSQADISIGSHFGGTGLGLAISSKLITLMGGELNVQSELGEGSTFSFRLVLEKSRTEGVHVYANQYAGLNVGILLPHQDVYRSVDQNLENYIHYLGATSKIYYYEDILQKDTSLPDILFVDQRYTRQENELTSLLELDTKIILMTTSEIKKEYYIDTEKVTRVVYKPMNLTKVIRAFKIATSPVELLEKKEEETIAFDGLRVLVAEDNPVNQKLMERILQKYGISVSIVDNGKKAVDSMQKEQFDMVFMDYEMPLMNGLEAIKSIAHYEDTENKKHTPMIMLSGEKEIESIYHREGIAIDDFLYKPIDIQRVLAVLQKYASTSTCVNNPKIIVDTHYIYPTCKVLVIEQNIINQKLIEHALVSVGIETVCSTGDREGMALFANQVFDMVFIALEPPLIDAEVLLNQMRAYEEEHFLEKTPILVLFDEKADDTLRDNYFALGMSDYLYKPLNVDAIKFHIEHFLQGKRVLYHPSESSALPPVDQEKSSEQKDIEVSHDSVIEQKKDDVVKQIDLPEIVEEIRVEESDIHVQELEKEALTEEIELVENDVPVSESSLEIVSTNKFNIKYIDIPLNTHSKFSQDV